MSEKNTGTMTIETIERQREYVKRQKKEGKALGLVFADAFLRGMRDVGYKNPAWALAEMLDNAFQAAANTVAVRFGFEASNKSQAKPDMVAVCDDGNGMIPEMISYAVRWGGTDREDDRTGFGRMVMGYRVQRLAWRSVIPCIPRLRSQDGTPLPLILMPLQRRLATRTRPKNFYHRKLLTCLPGWSSLRTD